jgi:cyclic beta-1,2-glucan synthetase
MCLAADIYAEPPHARRGGCTWYTGAAGWFYRAGMEWILGLQIRDGTLIVNPCIPKAWRSYSMTYRHGNAHYEITVENPNGLSHGVCRLELDGGCRLFGSGIALEDDGQLHSVRVVQG